MTPDHPDTLPVSQREIFKSIPHKAAGQKNKNAPLPCCLRYGREEYDKNTKRLKKF
jgi:hypothetical protein